MDVVLKTNPFLLLYLICPQVLKNAPLQHRSSSSTPSPSLVEPAFLQVQGGGARWVVILTGSRQSTERPMMHCGSGMTDGNWNTGKVLNELWEWFCKLSVEDRIQALTVEDPLWARLYLVLFKKEEKDGKPLRLKRETVNHMYKKLFRKESHPQQPTPTTTFAPTPSSGFLYPPATSTGHVDEVDGEHGDSGTALDGGCCGKRLANGLDHHHYPHVALEREDGRYADLDLIDRLLAGNEKDQTQVSPA